VGESTRANLPTVDIGQVVTRYQVTLEVDDRPGVLARVAGLLSDGRVSIATVEQTLEHTDEGAASARLVIGTHKALEQDLSETVARLAEDDVVERVVSVLRVEGD
jgi:homoserine dehydrogenase